MNDQMLISPWYWMIGGALLAVIEIFAPGVFLLWIGLGAILVGVALWTLPELSMSAQLAVFALAMLGSLSLGYVIQRRSGPKAGEPVLNQEMQDYIGRRFEALDDFVAGRGRVRVGDTSYSASCDGPVGKGEVVVVSAIDHGVLVVRRGDTQS